MTCTLCNADLPKGVPVLRRDVHFGRSRMLAAPMCSSCTEKEDTARNRAENIVIVMFLLAGLVFYGVCCT